MGTPKKNCTPELWKVEQHRTHFNALLKEHIRHNSRLICRDKLNEIHAFLKSPSGWKGKNNRKLRRRIRDSQFELFTFPDAEEVVCVRSQEVNSSDNAQLKGSQVKSCNYFLIC